ncbi:hypothetical protein IV203_007803 [Nitzschia inconspicua]|uniref:Uncharacterized protein n=1 Tax=Nitzschia inconspicua TaxID=303405 RepID=A0A9K3KXC2_9STRA|nr:hypothetical protein IV203_007803 [Nitzschia inconspicua]
MYGYTSKRLILRSKSQTTAPMSCDDRTMDVSSVSCLDFTRIPKLLDAAIENSNSESVLRSTTIKTDNTWTRLRQENLLSRPIFSKLNGPIMKKEKNKAFDLLDALSRSGSLPRIRSSMSLFV